MTDAVDARDTIGKTIESGLSDLDALRAIYQDVLQQVVEAQKAADKAAEEYARKINEVLATGWATPAALASQGHSTPKRRGGRKSGNGAVQ